MAPSDKKNPVTKPPQELPLGIQTFEEISNRGMLYVDKTALIYQIVTRGKSYFIARPRRFGKSLLISTLEAIFEGKRELFKNLALDALPYDWRVYPVIKLDMPGLSEQEDSEMLIKKLRLLLMPFALQAGVSFQSDDPLDLMFSMIIASLAQKGAPVVVLIDEYDKPLLSVVHDSKRLQGVRSVLKNFFGVLKAVDKYLRFVFITGVSQFAQVSVFSDLNQLTKLTFYDDFGTLLGYTDEEIDHYFPEHIKVMSEKLQLPTSEIREKLKQMYNGYQFCQQPPRVYNPYSFMSALHEKKLGYYWYETGTPTFLVNFLKENSMLFFDLEGKQYSQASLSHLMHEVTSEGGPQFKEKNLFILPALAYQTGYWTIKNYNAQDDNFTLQVSNLEVRKALTEILSTHIIGRSNAEDARKELTLVKEYVNTNNLDGLHELLKIICAGIPYTIQETRNSQSPECYYQTVFYMIFWLANLDIQVEVVSSIGRMDAVVTTRSHRYIFELKISGSAHEALNQIKEKKYYQKFLAEPRKIVLVGVNFDPKARNITQWLIEELMKP